jgi:hypothetical protein
MSPKQHFKPISRARKRRLTLPGYFDLGGKGLFLLVVLAASLLALLALAQTGRVVATGYHLRELQKQEKDLLWEQESLLDQIARATDPANLEQMAQKAEMETLKPQDITAIPLVQSDLSQIEPLLPIAEEP